jgi:hypothetical protein
MSGTGAASDKKPLDNTVKHFPRRVGAVRRSEFNELRDRVNAMERAFSDIADIRDVAVKTFRYMRRAVPLVVTAAVTAGYVDGRLGEFIKALFSG